MKTIKCAQRSVNRSWEQSSSSSIRSCPTWFFKIMLIYAAKMMRPLRCSHRRHRLVVQNEKPKLDFLCHQNGGFRLNAISKLRHATATAKMNFLKKIFKPEWGKSWNIKTCSKRAFRVTVSCGSRWCSLCGSRWCSPVAQLTERSLSTTKDPGSNLVMSNFYWTSIRGQVVDGKDVYQ